MLSTGTGHIKLKDCSEEEEDEDSTDDYCDYPFFQILRNTGFMPVNFIYVLFIVLIFIKFILYYFVIKFDNKFRIKCLKIIFC